jgi:ABC-type Fe3+-hydroxamate transport system substrate-binding protein
MRVVSLVPSATETLLALGVEPVGCTRFCEQPGIQQVGGTKNPDLQAIVTLSPHLVVVNDEENREEDARELERLGIPVHDMSPRTVVEVGPAVAALAKAVEAELPPGWTERMEGVRPRPLERRAFVPVWPKPWMTLNGDTYGSSLLSVLGVENVFADAPERYPAISIPDVEARAPQLVLLPTEPYAFRQKHVDQVAQRFPEARVALVDGQDLFWWGIRTPDAVARLTGTLQTLF